MPLTAVTRTYLEMTAPGELRPASTPIPTPKLERLDDCSVALFRYLYREVGRAYHWTDRSSWSDDDIATYLADPDVSIWLLSWEAIPAGYFELKRHADGGFEVAYFGLLPNFIGRGWGKYLLTLAVTSAWELGASRVWLHTCTLDHPAALPNYLKRGFRAVRQEVYWVGGEVGKRGSGEGVGGKW
jgi:GNAT superfamily N-acetyltransferase